jgi:beta-glucanase (GH16 family)
MTRLGGMMLSRAFVLTCMMMAMTGSARAQIDDGAEPLINGQSPADRYRMTFRDEFDGGSLDSTKWRGEFIGKRRHALTTMDAVSQSDGLLTIKTYTQPVANGSRQHYTGAISTRGKFSQAFGYFEARVNYDTKPGMWSAFWVHSFAMESVSNNPELVGQYHVIGTEIDVAEHRVTDRFGGQLGGFVQTGIHRDGYNAFHGYHGTLSPWHNAEDGFHTYGVRWSPAGYEFFVNGTKYFESATAISSVPHVIILSSEVEDFGWAGIVPTGGYGTLSATTTQFQVDYVRVWTPHQETPIPEPTLAMLLPAALLSRRRR